MVGMTSTPDETQPKTSPERLKYNPALSNRNIEATKWFGQPTSQDKIWMRRSGKIDASAEEERRKLIKSMSKRNAPKRAPKWQPPKERDIAENMPERPKQSMIDYENRRKMKLDQHTEKPLPVEATTISPTQTQSFSENIVVEPVVHSKDAVSIWESRLSEKHHKEELERQRLSVGKVKVRRERSVSETIRNRRDSESSVCSSCSAYSAVLPTSDHIESDSVDFSKVRDRWQVIAKKSKPPAPKENSSPNTKNSPNVTSISRESFSDLSQLSLPSECPSDDKNISESENFIDREIREAAEREERWKEEQRELKRLSSCEVKTDVTQLHSQFETKTGCNEDKSISLHPEFFNNETQYPKRKQKEASTRTNEKHIKVKDMIVTPVIDTDAENKVQLAHCKEETHHKYDDTVTVAADTVNVNTTPMESPLRSPEKDNSLNTVNVKQKIKLEYKKSENLVISHDLSILQMADKNAESHDQMLTHVHVDNPKDAKSSCTMGSDTETDNSNTLDDFAKVFVENVLFSSMHIVSQEQLRRDGRVNLRTDEVLHDSTSDKKSNQDDSNMHNEIEKKQEESERKQRIATLTSVVSPRGWEPGKGSAIRPVSAVKRPTANCN